MKKVLLIAAGLLIGTAISTGLLYLLLGVILGTGLSIWQVLAIDIYATMFTHGIAKITANKVLSQP